MVDLLKTNGKFYKENLHCHTTVSDGKRPMSILLKANMSKEIAELSDEVTDTATVHGLVKIYELCLG